ncbi:MAG TPA: DNA polymerase IV [Chroococcales cyanobacterium]
MGARSILHVDMDAFFASVAQRDRPELLGKPVIVGGHSTRRGVVASASYEARACGVHSAMPIFKALECCPQAVLVPVEMGKYRRISAQLLEIWGNFSPLVEALGFEEAYLDMTGSELLLGPVQLVAYAIRKAILLETGLSASVGGGSSKLLAKVASKTAKPAGVCVIPAGEEESWLYPRAVSVIPGVGPRTEERLLQFGIKTVGQLAKIPFSFLVSHFGAQGADFYAIARGQDPRVVCPGGPPKSMGGEETFDEDSSDPVFLRRLILKIVCELGYRLRKQNFLASTLSVKVRYGKTFETVERSRTFPFPLDDDEAFYEAAWELVQVAWDGKSPLRLIGTTFSNFHPNSQLSLFRKEKNIRLLEELDRLRDRYGLEAVRRASLLDE